MSGSVIDTAQHQQMNGLSSGATTVGGLLAPANARAQHARTVSLPGYADLNGQTQQLNPSLSHRNQQSFSGLSGFGGFGSAWGLNGWAEEEIPNGN
ncbi:MAG: hypothetical protein LQ337_003637 [Flavoplaca oasis]|nr:MAG: hypothetical protein LQ337_003637 [Flavoplaca oasis]